MVFSNKKNNNEDSRELKITIKFLSNEIRADGIDVTIHERRCLVNDAKNCKIEKINSEIESEIKLAILKKATILKKESNTNNKKSKLKTN